MTTPGFDVFVSYPHQDKGTADAVCAKLEAEGIRCWIAPRDIAPSKEWAEAIVDAIDKCRVMVLIFSAHANRSKQVHREVQQAFDGEKPVVPFRIEDVQLEKALRYYVGPVHWLDALTPPLEQHLKGLTASVRGLIDAASIATEADGGARQQRKPSEASPRANISGQKPPWLGRRNLAVILIIIGFIGLAAFFVVPNSPIPDQIQSTPSPASLTQPLFATDAICKNGSVAEKARLAVVAKHRDNPSAYLLQGITPQSSGQGACFFQTYSTSFGFQVLGSCCGPGSNFDIRAY
jgi:hypothetical protein